MESIEDQLIDPKFEDYEEHSNGKVNFFTLKINRENPGDAPFKIFRTHEHEYVICTNDKVHINTPYLYVPIPPDDNLNKFYLCENSDPPKGTDYERVDYRDNDLI